MRKFSSEEKIKMKKQSEKTFAEVFESFITSQKAKDISEVTIRNYYLHLQSISKHLAIQTAFKKIKSIHSSSGHSAVY